MGHWGELGEVPRRPLATRAKRASLTAPALAKPASGQSPAAIVPVIRLVIPGFVWNPRLARKFAIKEKKGKYLVGQASCALLTVPKKFTP